VCKERKNQSRKEKYQQETLLASMRLKEENYHLVAYNIPKDPKHLLIADGSEEISQIRKKKKLDFGKGEDQLEEGEEQIVPTEVIKYQDDMIIKNYEVDYTEEDPEVKMSGGLRGI
jgi:hypothetical protein